MNHRSPVREKDPVEAYAVSNPHGGKEKKACGDNPGVGCKYPEARALRQAADDSIEKTPHGWQTAEKLLYRLLKHTLLRRYIISRTMCGGIQVFQSLWTPAFAGVTK